MIITHQRFLKFNSFIKCQIKTINSGLVILGCNLLHEFSTSVELESENVCLSVCLCVCQSPQNFGEAWRLQKCSDLAEIFHTWSLGKYLGVFFSFLENFDFLGRGHNISPKRG